MNQITAIGRLTRDPELRNTNGGKSVCSMRIAIDRRGKDAGAVFVDVTAFDGTADSCAQYLTKGRQVAVSGRLEYSEWESKDDGGKRSKHEIVAQDVTFLDGPPTDDGDVPADMSDLEPVAAGVGTESDEDIPF
jgi:single-strand DNA-binding protein